MRVSVNQRVFMIQFLLSFKRDLSNFFFLWFLGVLVHFLVSAKM